MVKIDIVILPAQNALVFHLRLLMEKKLERRFTIVIIARSKNLSLKKLTAQLLGKLPGQPVTFSNQLTP